VRALAASSLLTIFAGCASPSSGRAHPDLAVDSSDLGQSGWIVVSPADAATVPPDMTVVPPDMTLVDLGPFPPGDNFLVATKNPVGYLSVKNQATANGSTTEFRKLSNTPDQHWQLLSVSTDVYQLVNTPSQSCLAVEPNPKNLGSGATTWLWTCGNGTEQQWKLKASSAAGYYNLVNIKNSDPDPNKPQYCLDLFGGHSQDGTQVFLYQCNGGDNQNWQFTHVK
jgi:hypothetical protein